MLVTLVYLVCQPWTGSRPTSNHRTAITYRPLNHWTHTVRKVHCRPQNVLTSSVLFWLYFWYFLIFFRVVSLAVGQSYDCPTASEATQVKLIVAKSQQNRKSMHNLWNVSHIARFIGPTWGPSGANRTQVGPMLSPWTLLSSILYISLRFITDGVTTNLYP